MGMSGAYDARGAGDAVVFSHGMLMDRTMFAPQLEALSGEYRTVAFDHRARRAVGHEPYDLYALADDFCALLDELELQRCVLAGMSMGGFMAVRAALRYPERVAGVVLIGASALPYAQEEQTHWEEYFARHRADERLPQEFAAEQADGHFAQRTRREQPRLVQAWTERFAKRTGEDTYLEVLSWSRQDDVLDRWAQLDVPVLIIHGDEDEAVPLAAAITTYERAQRGRLLVVPYGGHAVNLEYPEIVNAALRAFLQDVYAHESKEIR
jgi:pimeloyl-ACP methyl ester carboxylesterase